MKTNSYSCQPSHIYTRTRLQNKIIYIPVKNKINKTNSTWSTAATRRSVIMVTSVIYCRRRYVNDQQVQPHLDWQNILHKSLTNGGNI